MKNEQAKAYWDRSYWERKVQERTERLKKLEQLNAPSLLLENERGSIQSAHEELQKLKGVSR